MKCKGLLPAPWGLTFGNHCMYILWPHVMFQLLSLYSKDDTGFITVNLDYIEFLHKHLLTPLLKDLILIFTNIFHSLFYSIKTDGTKLYVITMIVKAGH